MNEREQALALAADICMQYAAELNNIWSAIIAQDCALKIRAKMKLYSKVP